MWRGGGEKAAPLQAGRGDWLLSVGCPAQAESDPCQIPARPQHLCVIAKSWTSQAVSIFRKAVRCKDPQMNIATAVQILINT